MKGSVSMRLGCLFHLIALVVSAAPAEAYVGRIEGEWRGRDGVDIIIGAKGFGWAFRGSVGKGWGEDGMLPHTVVFYFESAPCWLGVTMSADESRMQLNLLLALDRRCKILDGGYDRISD